MHFPHNHLPPALRTSATSKKRSKSLEIAPFKDSLRHSVLRGQGAPCSENQEQIVIEVLRDNINGITKACYLSIGSQRFCERINGLFYEETHGGTEDFEAFMAIHISRSRAIRIHIKQVEKNGLPRKTSINRF
ncbi:hypothetical protein R6Q59_025727 [Mikania micrantha]